MFVRKCDKKIIVALLLEAQTFVRHLGIKVESSALTLHYWKLQKEDKNQLQHVEICQL
jgi:hypothetical protein